jgi:hypothetical protein
LDAEDAAGLGAVEEAEEAVLGRWTEREGHQIEFIRGRKKDQLIIDGNIRSALDM